jgi:ABC-type bacteriocin/lantibiotic exporter with double-glycine peptidase domain
MAIIAAGALKFLIGMVQNIIGQKTLADMRKALYRHILTLPLVFFRKTQPGMVVSALVTEIASVGDFVGIAIAVPVSNILTLLAFATYLIWLNPLLAIISLSIYPIVLILVPRLQKKANLANKKRVDATRDMSSLIGESITGIHEIHGNGSFGIESHKFNGIADKMLKIRIVWNLYRLAVKTVNNFFNNLSPFIIFILGGYLAMNGQLEIGSLVAFLSAQEKLAEPWKELLDFYQSYQDASVRYKRTMDYFDSLPEHPIEPRDREPYELDGNLVVENLSFETDTGIRLLNDISFTLKPGSHMALVGFSGSGKSTLAQCIGQLYKYTGGRILLDNREVASLSKKDMVNNIGFVSQNPFIFSGTIEENLNYASKALVEKEAVGKEAPGKETAGTLPTLDDKIAVLHQTGIFVDVLRFGLNAILEFDKHRDLITKLIKVRDNFQQTYGDTLADYVEFFNEDVYLYHSSIAENIIFGSPNQEAFNISKLSGNKYFNDFLSQADLKRPLLSLGAELSKQTVDILGNLPPEDVFFEQSPLQPEELDDFKSLVKRLEKYRLHQLSKTDRKKLLELSLRFVPGIHKVVGLPMMLEHLILEGRALFKEKISEDHPDSIAFLQMSEYIYSQTILNNIFFGKAKTTSTHAQEKINQCIVQLLVEDEENLLETIVEIGMQFQVGSKGDKLSGGQRQKLAIARAFLKKPRMLIMDEATSALDNKSQARIQNLLENRWKGKSSLLAVVHRLDIVKNFDAIAVLKAGKIVEMGTYNDLIEKKGALYELEFGRH